MISRGHGRREEQRLARRRAVEGTDDAADRLDEAHVEHAVGFIEHEDAHAGEIHEALLEEIDEPAGRGDEDVDPVLQGADLRVLADAPEDHRATEAGGAAVGREGLADLRGEFAGGGEDEGARETGGAGVRRLAVTVVVVGTWGVCCGSGDSAQSRLIPGFDGRGQQALEDGEGEGGGLARAGLGAAQDVAAREDRRNGLALIGVGVSYPSWRRFASSAGIRPSASKVPPAGVVGDTGIIAEPTTASRIAAGVVWLVAWPCARGWACRHDPHGAGRDVPRLRANHGAGRDS